MGTTKHLSHLCHSIATMLESGIDIQKAMKISGQQCKNRRISDAISRCEEAVGSGSSLSAALKKEKQLPILMRTMVEAGEKTGHLNTVFAELGAFFEMKDRLWRSFLVRITMPALQYIAAVFVLSLARYVIRMIQEQPGDLATGLAAGYGIPAAIIALLWVITRCSSGTRLVHEVLWNTPLISRVVRPLALARFSTCFKFTLAAGMHTKAAIETAFDASGNEAFKARAPVAKASVARGESLTSALGATGLFDEEYIAIVDVAEQSGKMMDRMQWLSQHHNEKAETALAVLAAVSARLIWIMVAVFMAFFIFRMFSAYIMEIQTLGGGI